MLDLGHARNRLVDIHVARRGVRDERVLQAMRIVPCENFVEQGFEEFAYEDALLPIAEGQTISQPYIVARMIDAAELGPADRVLEVGVGSYAAAVMSLLVEKVFSIRPSSGVTMPKRHCPASSTPMSGSMRPPQ